MLFFLICPGRGAPVEGFADGLQLIFHEALPDTAFTLVVPWIAKSEGHQLFHGFRQSPIHIVLDSS